MVNNTKIYHDRDYVVLEAGFFKVFMPLHSDSMTPEVFTMLKEDIIKDLGEKLDAEYINYIKRRVNVKH